jgi:hypothetical protein
MRGIKGSSQPVRPNCVGAVKEWKDYCLKEFKLDSDTVSDSYMTHACFNDLKKYERSDYPLNHFISQNDRKRLRELGVFFRESNSTKVNWSVIQKYLSMIPPFTKLQSDMPEPQFLEEISPVG